MIMKPRYILLLFISVICSSNFCSRLQARKIKHTYKKSISSAEKDENQYTAGSQAISSDCLDCGGNYRLSDIIFSGYDKKRTSDKESFFVTNTTDRVLTGFSLYINYVDRLGNQLHKQYIKKPCLIPPGETHKIDIRSWDTQHSFFYQKSETNPKKGDPYTITFDPVTIYLQYPNP